MKIHATTILTVQHAGKVAMGGDGQMTLGSAVMKSDAMKIRKLLDRASPVRIRWQQCRRVRIAGTV